MLSPRRRPALAAVAALLAVLIPAPASAVPGQDCAEPGRAEIGGSWPRAALQADAVSPLANGFGVVVAVLSTGVDAGQPQLDGRVSAGVDVVDQAGAANQDCTGTGTQVAGVIAGQRGGGDADVAGLAPGSRILPIRVLLDDPAGSESNPALLARGITAAVQNDADVIVVAAAVYQNQQQLRVAVAGAVDQGVVVVAAAGDLGGPDDGNPTPFPAAYPGVIGVGAIDQNGRISPSSQRGDYVDLVAPGVAVPTLQTGRGLVEVDGTAVAAGFVGAAAALLRDRREDLGPQAVAQVLTATASPAPIGEAFGAGVVDPVAAVTGRLVDPDPRPLPALDPAPPPDTATDRLRRAIALVGAGIAAIVAVAVLLAAAAIRRSRRRHWRPALAPPAPVHDEPLEPGPPVMLLDERPGSG
ncbi:S8 family serine peptidase [Actinoplanes aureus]|uniref:S8 family serine peptidase n=1 Tax=Actinoplanes aureus TaxID=2792083 RepID=A0A931CHG8_9ACTN|nr:S8 family serine peptidase [Actinoplanes aureus]MBG0568097.1 S8 family serine peptidase [Actinoplanes aureus]